MCLQALLKLIKILLLNMFKVLELSELDVCLVGTYLNFQWLGGQKKLLDFGLLGEDHYPLWLGT